MLFIKKHTLLLCVLIFTLSFFFTFLYVDLGQVMYYSTKDGNISAIKIFILSFFTIVDIIFLILSFIFFIKYLRKTKTKKKWLISIIVILFELIYTFYYSMFSIAPGFTFYPKYLDRNILEYSNVRQVSVNVLGNTYTSTYYDNNHSKVTLFFVGNGMASTDIFYRIRENNLIDSERNLLVMDYPMFGDNQGNLTEKTIYKEIDKYMDFLIKDEGYSLADIRVCGYSIGTGLACYTAKKYNVESLVLFAPYHKFQVAMNQVVPAFYGPLETCVRFKFDSYSRAKDIKCPVKVYYSYNDDAIPASSTLKLITQFTNVTVIEVKNATHAQVLNIEKLIENALH